MASIDERGPYQWRARVRRKVGDKIVTLTETKESYDEAKRWADIQEGKVVGDEYVDRSAARALNVKEACEWFMDRIAPINTKTGKRMPKSPHAKNQLSKLKYWVGSDFVSWSIVSVKPWDWGCPVEC